MKVGVQGSQERSFVVRGKYDVALDTPPWGWKTVLEQIDEDHLTIAANHVMPDGKEGMAAETTYRRAKE